MFTPLLTGLDLDEHSVAWTATKVLLAIVGMGGNGSCDIHICSSRATAGVSQKRGRV